MSDPFDEIPLATLRRVNTYELIADSVVDLIRLGRLTPGDPLPTERALMERFGAGRSSVREAIRVLESRGVINGGRGGFVISDPHATLATSLALLIRLGGGTIADIVRLRRTLEVESAGAAAKVRTAADLDELRAIDAAWRAAAVSQSAESVAEAGRRDMELHLSIVEIAGNAVVLAVMHGVASLVSHLYRDTMTSSRFREAVGAQHAAIIDAIAAQDEAAARRAMDEHVSRVAAQFGTSMDSLA